MVIISNKMPYSKKYTPLLYLVMVLAFFLHIDNFFLKTKGSLGFIGLYFLFLSLCPYLIIIFYFKVSKDFYPSIIGCTIALILDSVTHYYVFISPQNSTAATGLLFTPVMNIFLVVAIIVFASLFKKTIKLLSGLLRR